MNEKIRFHVEYCDRIPEGKTMIAGKEGSMIFVPKISIGAFSIHLYDWAFELTTLEESENKYQIRFALGNIYFSKYKYSKLIIPEAQRGKVYACLNFPHPDGVYYCEFAQFQCEKYYDPQNGIFAVGDITAKGNAIEFASGQYVVLNEMGALMAVYVRLSS